MKMAWMKGTAAFGAALAIGWCSGSALAQQGGGGGGGGGGRGPRLDPAKAAAAQKLEAEGVAHDLGITGDAVGKMVAAYQANRDAHRKEMDVLMDNGQRGPETLFQMQDINDTQRAALKKELDAIIGDKAGAATDILGTYAREWDRYVDVYSGLGVSDDKKFKGLSLIAKYNVDATKARMEAMQAMDMDGARAAGEAHKAKLDAALKDVLDAGQLAKWTEGTARRGGGGPGGPGGGPGGPGGGPGGPGGGPGGPGAGAPPPPPPPQN